jgi:hypothetical protein
MPYGAVPDDVEIQKLTRAQQNALSRHNIHENINTFLGNENTPLLMGGVALLAALPILSKLFFDSLELENIIISDEQKTKVQAGFTSLLIASPATGPIVVGKKIWDTLTGEKDEDTSNGAGGLYGFAGGGK